MLRLVLRKKGKAWTALFVAGLLAAWSFAPGHAAHAQEVRTITFEEAIRIALQQNTDLKRAQNDVQLRDAYSRVERMDFLPQLQLSSSRTRTFGRSFSQEEGAIINETSDFFGADASASVNLFNGFENFSSLRRAELEEEASTLWLERTREDVIFQVIDRFTALLQSQQLTQVREQELAAQQDLLQQVESFVDVGRRPVSDLYQQQAVRAEARAALSEAERQAALNETELIQILQLDPQSDYAFDAPALADTTGVPALTDTAAAASPVYDTDRLQERAFAQRADLGALERSVAAAEQGVRIAQSGYWPSLSLGASYGSDWSSTGGGSEIERQSFFDQLDSRRGGSVRLSLSFPLFDRLQTRTNVEDAQVQLQNTRYDLQDQRQQVALQVRRALLDYRSAQTQLEAAEERLEAAELAQEASRRRYELGAATFVELTQAISGYVAARSAHVQARYDVLRAQKLIDYYAGTLDTTTSLLP